MSAGPADVPTPRLTVQTSVQGDATVVRCRGKLTAGVTDILRDEVKPLIGPGKRIILDLTDLTQMDSLGLGAIVGLYVSAKAAGSDLQLINLSKRVRELLSITNLLSLFDVYGEYPMKLP